MRLILEDDWWFRRLNRGLGFLQGCGVIRRMPEAISSDESIIGLSSFCGKMSYRREPCEPS